MAKQRKGKKGLVFEGKLDLSRWYFPRLDARFDDALDIFEEEIQSAVEKAKEKFIAKVGKTEDKIQRISGEVLEIIFEKDLCCGFWDLETKPQQLTVHFSDLAEDGYYVYCDIQEAVRGCLMDHCSRDGYVEKEYEERILNFATMLSDLSEELKTAIRPDKPTI